jgi:tetratricopeptide (TPR) repeat protein
MVAIPERGTLRETPLPRLLLDLYAVRFNGTLRLSRDRMDKAFLLQEGVPIFAESNLASETLGVQLMDAGKISRDDYERVSARLRREGCKEGKAMLDLGVLAPKTLFLALKEQVRSRVVDCFGWPQGDFVVEPADGPSADAQPFRADIYALVQEGIETHWSADEILVELETNMDQGVARTRKLSRIQDRLLWDDAVQAFIDALDGTQTLWQALQHARTPRAMAAAWVLNAVGAIDFRAPTAGNDANLGREVELVTPVAPRDAAPETDKGAGARGDVRVDAAILEEIEARYGRLGELDHYAMLGVESNAAPAVIRRAYLEAARRYHPDALGRAGIDGEMRERANKVFAGISKAHATLSNAARRREYDASLANEEADIDVERLAAAEGNFRKGNVLLRQGNFRGALEYLKPAVDLWPEEGVYQGALGWCLYKKVPSEPESARKHLECAYELEPRDAEIVFRLSVVLKAQGDHVASASLLQKARSLDPEIG